MRWRSDTLPLPMGATILPHGQGRSYGDSCLNPGGYVISTGGLDRFIAFDAASGVLQVETGVRLADIHRLTLPQGWYLPVVPGTQFVSVGGAIASDVHGKNHHRAGTFGLHVARFELLRSDGRRFLCSPEMHSDWFAATIGGLGLTGLVTWAELQMRRVPSRWIVKEILPFASITEFCALCDASDATHEYTVAWFDCFSYRAGSFRGLLTRANHAAAPDHSTKTPEGATPILTVPFAPPVCLLHPVAMRAFNRLYFGAGVRHVGQSLRAPLQRFMYPLDRIGHWNRLYGPRGFFQLQCLLPQAKAEAGIDELLACIAGSGQGTFLAVLKRFGSGTSPGMLSFPQKGITLALDFPNRSAETLDLMGRCHTIVRRAGGRIYPAKDACMDAATFEVGYPQWRELLPFVDPAFASGFWTRVTGPLLARGAHG